MKILITGGSGFLGTALSQALQAKGIKGEKITVTWVSRSPEKEKSKNIASPLKETRVISYDELATTSETFDIIINLAGAGIADKRWTDVRKAELLDSRIRPTQAVIDYIQRITVKPKLFISGSAIGWYGIQAETDSTALDENSPARPDFAHELCEKWENLALSVVSLVPIAIVRTGVVIDPNGGMMSRLITPFKLGVGGKLGTGRQMMSWISREDWVRAVMFIIEKSVSPHLTSPHRGEELPLPMGEEYIPQGEAGWGEGNNPQIYNLTAPTPVTNLAFTQAVGQWLHRPTLFTLPRFLLKLLLGEMATLLIDGQKVVPKHLLDNGFEFKDLHLMEALQKP